MSYQQPAGYHYKRNFIGCLVQPQDDRWSFRAHWTRIQLWLDWTWLDFDSNVLWWTLLFITTNISNIWYRICPGPIPRNPIKTLKSIQTIASSAVELNWQNVWFGLIFTSLKSWLLPLSAVNVGYGYYKSRGGTSDFKPLLLLVFYHFKAIHTEIDTTWTFQSVGTTLAWTDLNISCRLAFRLTFLLWESVHTRLDRSQFALRKCSHSFRSISVCFEKVFTLI